MRFSRGYSHYMEENKMIEIIGAKEAFKIEDERTLVTDVVERLKNFISMALSHTTFSNYNTDMKFKKICDLARVFDSHLSDKWYVAWKKYWTHEFKKEWLVSLIDELKERPFKVIRIHEEDLIRNGNYYEIMGTLHEIFPYMNTNTDSLKDNTDITENDVKKFLDLLEKPSDIPKKKKLKFRHKKKESVFDITLLNPLTETDYIVDGEYNPSAFKTYYLESKIKEVHKKKKGSVIFIWMKMTMYNMDQSPATKEFVTIHGYDEYDFLKSSHSRFITRQFLYKKCTDIIKTVVDHSVKELDIANLKENHESEYESQKTIVKEGGNLYFNKFIEFWKTIRS